MKKLIYTLVILAVAACTPVEEQSHKISLKLTGEMLFSGANTLQMPVKQSATALMQEANIKDAELEAVGVNAVTVKLTPDQRGIMESVLLQIVSDNQEMITLGTMSPLPDGTTFDLKLAEDIDLLPYLKDQGATWVLDANLTEDHMDLMKVQAHVSITLNYTQK